MYPLPLAGKTKETIKFGIRTGDRGKEDCTTLYIDGTRTFDTKYRVVHAVETSFRLLQVDCLVGEARAAARATGTCCTTHRMTQYVTFSQGLHELYREKIYIQHGM